MVQLKITIASSWIMFSLGLGSPLILTTAFISSVTRHGNNHASSYVPTIGRLGASPVNNDIISSRPPAPKTSTEESSLDPATTTFTFTSPTFRVYIEDTDAYGVMYNGNYIRSFERALSHFPRKDKKIPSATSPDNNDAPSSQQLGKNNNDQWILSFITNQKFRSSPALGEEYVVRGELIERRRINDGDINNGDGVDEDVEVWHLEMATQNKDAGDDNWIVHNSVNATFTRSIKKVATTVPAIPSSTICSNDIPKLGKLFEQRHTPYHDEFDMHLQQLSKESNASSQVYHIPLRSAMNFFFRSSTGYLGGPDMLRKLQVEDDILMVVTGVDDGELLLDSIAFEHNMDGDDENDGEVLLEDTLDLHPSPGREVIVQSNFIAKRQGMIVDCHHRLFMDVESSDGKTNRRLLAQATVTIMALKGSSHRPTSKLPSWILDIIM